MKVMIVIALLGVPAVARAETFGYVDTARVYTEATEAKRLLADVQADGAAKNREVAAANQSAHNAASKSAEAQQLQRKADELARIDQADFDKHNAETTKKLRARLAEVLAKIRVERRLSQVAAGAGLLIVPGTDLTDETIRRWDAADAQGMADKLAKAEAENAALRAKAAEKTTTKGTPP